MSKSAPSRPESTQRRVLARTNQDWVDLVDSRSSELASFLEWASVREKADSMRLQNRQDIRRVQTLLPLFDAPWWASVVYSCFDSEIGTRAVAEYFRTPVDAQTASELLSRIDLPPGAVKGHRVQPAHKGARIALISACEKADDFARILLKGRSFHDRYEDLRLLKAKYWGRTTRFDLLVRAGGLGIGGNYKPDRAYLADSTGPRNGFLLLWGIEVSPANADECEGILREWTARWDETTRQVGADWSGAPYGPGDFENSLCIYQERGSPGYKKGT